MRNTKLYIFELAFQRHQDHPNRSSTTLDMTVLVGLVGCELLLDSNLLSKLPELSKAPELMALAPNAT
jgi:hypothetical protein